MSIIDPCVNDGNDDIVTSRVDIPGVQCAYIHTCCTVALTCIVQCPQFIEAGVIRHFIDVIHIVRVCIKYAGLLFVRPDQLFQIGARRELNHIGINTMVLMQDMCIHGLVYRNLVSAFGCGVKTDNELARLMLFRQIRSAWNIIFTMGMRQLFALSFTERCSDDIEFFDFQVITVTGVPKSNSLAP